MLLSKNEIDIKKIKLVIWDLDNTLWDGTISEMKVSLSDRNRKLIIELTERGIVNSICSKNDWDVAKNELEKYGIWNYFVFSSIDWTMKGTRIKNIISDMALRPANVLFVDDEPLNLQNAIASVSDQLMCATPDDAISALEEQMVNLKVDTSCPRLKQYKVLEEKREAKNEFSSDEEFLAASEITVTISSDCDTQFDRLLELINRSNQLNYTKKRIDSNEFHALLNDSNNLCGYVSCKDKYGNYGIIGFYAMDIAKKSLIHFLFSCRTLGMGIEQYIYAYLGFPALEVVGDVVVNLNVTDRPSWITLLQNTNVSEEENAGGRTIRILAKGPCDVAQIIPFFSTGIEFDEEFSYVSRTKTNLRVDAQNHTTQILQSLLLEDAIKKELCSSIEFLDNEFYSTKTFSSEYDYIIISGLVDASLGLYRNKQNPELILAYEQYTIDITDPSNWGRYINSIEPFTKEFFSRFKDEWSFLGIISDELLMSNLEEIRKRISDKTRIIILGAAEVPFPGKVDPELEGRHIINAHFNTVYKEFVGRHKDNCLFIDVNNYLGGDSNYADTINHYKKIIYYKIAEEIKSYISTDFGGTTIEMQGEDYLHKETKKQQGNMLKRKIKRIIKVISYGMYKIVGNILPKSSDKMGGVK